MVHAIGRGSPRTSAAPRLCSTTYVVRGTGCGSGERRPLEPTAIREMTRQECWLLGLVASGASRPYGPHMRRPLPRKCSAQEKRDRRTNNDDTSGGHSDHGKSEQQYNGKSC